MIFLYLSGTLLLSSAQNEATDTLWVLSGDSFPFQNMLMEGQSVINIDGRVWALEEIPYKGQLAKLYSESFGSQNPPSSVIQHAQAARTFVLISAQGSHIVSKLRPVDHLRQLLIENGGPDADPIKAFFQLHGDAQACATCLILACTQNVTNQHIADWALRAFFKYGGEPRLVFPVSGGQRPAPQAPFSPNYHSTPAPPHIQNLYGGNVMTPEMLFSGKHNGLYLYFSRLLRPLWQRTLLVPANNPNLPLMSSVKAEEIDWIIVQLLDLKCFIEKNAQMPGSATPGGKNDNSTQQQDAYLRERQSLMFLQQLLNHSLQVLGLWKVVCEHGFELLSKSLTQDNINLIKGMYYR